VGAAVEASEQVAGQLAVTMHYGDLFVGSGCVHTQLGEVGPQRGKRIR